MRVKINIESGKTERYFIYRNVVVSRSQYPMYSTWPTSVELKKYAGLDPISIWVGNPRSVKNFLRRCVQKEKNLALARRGKPLPYYFQKNCIEEVAKSCLIEMHG